MTEEASSIIALSRSTSGAEEGTQENSRGKQINRATREFTIAPSSQTKKLDAATVDRITTKDNERTRALDRCRRAALRVPAMYSFCPIFFILLA